ncbi:MAG: sensor histidine kinase [Deltaproteobacteria bacterium]|nr:sensor histidine kinase [Deltaproteobacteria bacterium]
MGRRWRLLPDDPQLGWAPYVWLLYLGFVFLIPVFGGFTQHLSVWVASVVATAVFLPVYFYGYWVEGPRLMLLAMVIAGIGTLLTPFNPGSNTFFIFSAFFAGRSVHRPIHGLATVGVVVFITALVSWWLAPTIFFWGPAMLGASIVGLWGILATQRTREVAELRIARAEVEALARIAERERIASDLHDLLGHTLSVIALKSELAQRLVSRDPERAEQEMTDVQGVARQALSEVRTAVGGYRVGSGAGLRQELDGAAAALEAAGVELVVDEGPEHVGARLDATHEGVVALAVREAITNVMRHARAQSCTISFFGDDQEYGVEIADDGRGMGGHPGQGLLAMQRRVEALGGRLSIEDRNGTRLRLTFSSGGSGLGASEDRAAEHAA